MLSNKILDKKNPQTTEIKAESLFDRNLKGQEYIRKLEEYLDQTAKILSDYLAHSVMDEYKKILSDVTNRHKNNEFSIDDIINKERLLELAFKYKQELLATNLCLNMNKSKQEMVWLAVENDCCHMLTLVLRDSISEIDIFSKDKMQHNLLHMAAIRCNLNTLKCFINGLGDENIKKLINEPSIQGYTPVHCIAGKSCEFDEMVQLFADLGGNFKIKDISGEIPSQRDAFGGLSPARVELYKKLGAPSKTLKNAITSNDLEAVKENLAESSKAELQRIFISQGDWVKVPVHKPLGGSMLRSTCRPVIQHAIYHRHTDLVQFIIDEVLIMREIFVPNKCMSILKENLDYTNELITNNNNLGANSHCRPEILKGHEEIKTYLECAIEKIKLANEKELEKIESSNDKKMALLSLIYPGTLFKETATTKSQEEKPQEEKQRQHIKYSSNIEDVD